MLIIYYKTYFAEMLWYILPHLDDSAKIELNRNISKISPIFLAHIIFSTLWYESGLYSKNIFKNTYGMQMAIFTLHAALYLFLQEFCFLNDVACALVSFWSCLPKIWIRKQNFLHGKTCAISSSLLTYLKQYRVSLWSSRNSNLDLICCINLTARNASNY